MPERWNRGGNSGDEEGNGREGSDCTGNHQRRNAAPESHRSGSQAAARLPSNLHDGNSSMAPSARPPRAFCFCSSRLALRTLSSPVIRFLTFLRKIIRCSHYNASDSFTPFRNIAAETLIICRFFLSLFLSIIYSYSLSL